VDKEFARTLAAVLSPEGAFELTTDAHWYAEEAAGKLAQGGWFRLTGPEPLEGGLGTRYERKWREQGRGIWHLLAEKVAGAKVERIAEGEMPHARTQVSMTREKVARAVGLKEAWPGGAFVIKEAFFAPDGRTALLRAFSTDQDFQQHYFLAVVPDQTGAMVKLDGATVPFRTPAVKRSVVVVAAALKRGKTRSR
jgi:tRNA (guanine-N7-)-methyltransferase